jgi:hypothetical protein
MNYRTSAAARILHAVIPTTAAPMVEAWGSVLNVGATAIASKVGRARVEHVDQLQLSST